MAKEMSLVQVLPSLAQAEARRLVPKEQLAKLKFFPELKPRDQEGLIEDAQLAVHVRKMHTVSGLVLGEVLERINTRLARYSQKKNQPFYRQTLRALNFKTSQADKYRQGYKNAIKFFGPNPAVVEEISRRGLNMISYGSEAPLGKYTVAAKQLGPPDPRSDAKRYVDQLEDQRKGHSRARKKHPGSDEDNLDITTGARMMFRAINTVLKRISGGQRRQNALEKAIGWALQHSIGGVSRMTIEAATPPSDVLPKPKGRPRLVENKPVAEGASATG